MINGGKLLLLGWENFVFSCKSKEYHENYACWYYGGGLCVIYRKQFKISKKSYTFRTFECLELTLNCGSQDPLKMVTIYRPPPSTRNKLTSCMFFEEFSSFLESFNLNACHFILHGDFNIHMDIAAELETRKMNDLLSSCCLKQHVTEPTHRCGHMLDLVITNEMDNFIDNISVIHSVPSDHSAICFDMSLSRPPRSRRSVTFRKLREIDYDCIREDITNCSFKTDPSNDIENLTKQYNSDLNNLLDKHAPQITREITSRPNTPWYNEALRKLKQEKRAYERKWRKSNLCVDKLALKNKTYEYKKALHDAKTSYHQNVISQCNQGQLFREIKILTVKKSSQSLPSNGSKLELARKFSKFFDSKIRNLRIALDVSAPSELSINLTEACESTLRTFDILSIDDVFEIIKGSKMKCCSLDPLPAAVTKNVLDDLLPSLTKIVNMSLQSGCFPSELKKALVIPLLKKDSLDPEVLKHYRPISNLPYLGKLIERAAIKQYVDYLSKNNLFASSQSAYRQHHSTETALVRVTNDILRSLDKPHGEVILVLLDLTAAFDTIDHVLLLDRLQRRFGIGSKVLKWFASYLKNRQQSVIIDSEISDPQVMDWGIPQGSIGGPILFVSYTTPVEDIIRAHGLSCVIYADDTQLFISMDRSRRQVAVEKIELCIRDIKTWMTRNYLVLNDSKTEILHFTSKFSTDCSISNITAGDANVNLVSQARDLGVILDDNMSMQPQINNICRSATFAIKKVSSIRKYLDKPTTEKLINAFVTSRLDGCNSILSGLCNQDLQKLQHIQNCAARLITLTKKHEHITPVLFDLHWLPIAQRIEFKVLLLTFKIMNGLAPDYLCNLIQPYVPPRTLRSGSKYLLSEPVGRTMTYGNRAFSIMAPKLWNNIPITIRMAKSVKHFKKLLKNYLFEIAYKM